MPYNLCGLKSLREEKLLKLFGNKELRKGENYILGLLNNLYSVSYTT
jgi:hypothetical protein